MLWNSLKTCVKNIFLERLVVQKQFLQVFREHNCTTLHEIAELVARRNPNSEFAKLVRDRLELFPDNQLQNLDDFKPHLKTIIREIFKRWFFGKFIHVQEPILEESHAELRDGLARPISILDSVLDRRKSVDLKTADLMGNGRKESVGRLEKIDDLNDSF